MVAAQRAALQLPPKRTMLGDFKKTTISRAEGGQLVCRVGRSRLFIRVADNVADQP